MLDGLRWAWPYRLSLARARAQPGYTVTIAIDGPVTRAWHLVAAGQGWQFRDRPGPRTVAGLTLSTEQAWRLLTNNLPAAARAGLQAWGDIAITDVLIHTRAIIGTPKWA